MNQDNGRTARRAQLRRISQISERIRSGDYPNAVQLADEFEVSHNTIKRDIEFMRDELELPIEYDQQRHGYYFTQSANKLFRLAINTNEVRDLIAANHAISEYLSTPMEPLMRQAFRQMKDDLGLGIVADTLDGSLSFRPFAAVKIDIPALQTIAAALRRKRTLKFNYTNPGSDALEPREGHPYHVSHINGCWYVFLYCLRDRAVRTFALCNMRDPVMTDQRFTKPKAFDPDEHLRGGLIVATGNEDHEVVVELDRWATDIMRHRPLPAITNFVELPDRRSRVHLSLNTLEEIERWILVLGIHATVLKPEALRKRLGKIVHELSQRYQEV